LAERWQPERNQAVRWNFASASDIMDEIATANLLTQDFALDPVAKIPEFKVCAVNIESSGRGRK
jgi:hypothetical protein